MRRWSMSGCARCMVNSFNDVIKYAEKHKVHNRTAAYMLALDRVQFAIKLRGLYSYRRSAADGGRRTSTDLRFWIILAMRSAAYAGFCLTIAGQDLSYDRRGRDRTADGQYADQLLASKTRRFRIT